jgi:hypothetical protein
MSKVYSQADLSLAWVKATSQRRLAVIHNGFPTIYLTYACAMVNVALKRNETARPLWVDIRCAWGEPGCAAILDASISGSDAVNGFFFTGNCFLYGLEVGQAGRILRICILSDVIQTTVLFSAGGFITVSGHSCRCRLG